MAFEMQNDSTQFAQFVTLIILTPLGIVVTALRFVAVRRVERKVGAEDWLAIIATLFTILTNLSALMAIGILNGRQINEEIAESKSDYVRMRKVRLNSKLSRSIYWGLTNQRQWDICGLYFYFVQTLAVKLSVLALCYRIFSFNNTGGKICIYVLGALQTILFTCMCIFQGFQCVPIQRYFDPFVPGHCTDEGTVILGGEIPNSIIDFAMVILAMVMIRSVQLSKRNKLRIMFIFGLGFIVGIIGFAKVAITYSVSELWQPPVSGGDTLVTLYFHGAPPSGRHEQGKAVRKRVVDMIHIGKQVMTSKPLSKVTAPMTFRGPVLQLMLTVML
ncbi:hypothetical protein N7478_009124 [Penicillium angulare]|uniref:uncharacterized protein n=1 Tax=Penicillium angulare TaxID=116970 RepID=UPI00253F6836|nr:uncharacterized protein N7478_009124 [Penicillium angulare]KAJ5273999.1 hypothetical protein N7478_009124 [Penicillium angulare]